MATLKPPSATHRSSSQPPGPPRAPLKADPSATIADTAVFQGTHPITIGPGTVIHPRARFYSYEGPITIGDGCIISEKAVIGAAPESASKERSASSSRTASPSPSTPTDDTTQTIRTPAPEQGLPIRISYFVTIGPLSSILPGSHIHSAAAIDSLATIHRNAEVGSHAKICAGCVVPQNGRVAEWTVVWGSGIGQRRARARGARPPCSAVRVAARAAQVPVPGSAPEGKLIEDARLMVLVREREALGKMIAGAKKR